MACIVAADLEVEQINSSHTALFRNFSSFEKELADFLKEDALNNQAARVSTTHLWFHKPSKELVGYVTLLTDKISLHAPLKEKFRNKGINYKSLPAVKIGRICVADKFLRRGIGTLMVQSVIYLMREINEKAGCRFITVDAKRNPDKAKDSLRFYKAMNFEVYKSRKKGAMPMYKDVSKLIDSLRN